MPGVAAPVEGVANVRGTLVTVVRGDVVLGGIPGPARTPSAWVVVLNVRGGRVGLGVDDVLATDDGDGDFGPVDLDGALAAVLGDPKS